MKKNTRQEVLEIAEADPSLSWADIAARVGVSRQRVQQIAGGAGKSKYAGSSVGRRDEYKCWHNMIARCTDEEHKLYRYYGARGIRVCDRWLNSFPAFLTDMGPKPSPDLSLDRINNDGNYEPSNCRWATKSQQVMNRRQPERVLTPMQVREAQNLRDLGTAVSLIAKAYNVSRGTIRNYTIARRKRR